MKHLLLLALQVAPLALANGQQSLDAICDTAHSLALRQSARDAFDKHQYQVAALHFSEALQECPAQRDILIELSEAQALAGDEKDWATVTVPHTWNRLGNEGTERAPLSNSMQGVGWYRLHFKVPRAAADSRYFLQFNAVAHRTYTVQSRNSAFAGAWTRVADVVALPTNRMTSITNGLSGTATRYYRLVTPQTP